MCDPDPIQLERYDLRELIAEGGMAKVRRAVAVKAIRQPIAHKDIVRQRFRREARPSIAESTPDSTRQDPIRAGMFPSA